MGELETDKPLPRSFWQGIEQFNQGEYYACHDTLEALWMEALAAEKPFYQGILQIAVALYHLGNHNWRGAAILFGEGLNRLQPFEPAYRDIDITNLVDCGFAWLEALQTTGPDQVGVLAEAIAPGTDPILVSHFNITLPALHIFRTQQNG